MKVLSEYLYHENNDDDRPLKILNTATNKL